MKKINTTFLFFILIFTYSQVGINTQNPLGTFHIDGSSDNSDSSDLTTSQQANDVIITNEGYLGIGTTSPSNNLEVKGTIAFPDVAKSLITSPYSALGINTDSGVLGTYTAGSSPISIRTSTLVKAISTSSTSPTILPIISDSSGNTIINTAGITYNDTDNYIQFTEEGTYRIEITVSALCTSSSSGTGLNILYQYMGSTDTSYTNINESRIIVLSYDNISSPGISIFIRNFLKDDKVKLGIYRSVGNGSSCQLSLPTNADASNQIIITKL